MRTCSGVYLKTCLYLFIYAGMSQVRGQRSVYTFHPNQNSNNASYSLIGALNAVWSHFRWQLE